ncbi:MAG: cation-translocating P-type ATPase [Sediminibacterium sp.]|nr:cation-translocating P-type ATPase [Sediminibacterium sp.]
MEIIYPIQNVHTLSVEEIIQSFNTNAENGITTTEAGNRINKFGANIYEAQKQKSIWMMMLLQFKNPIVYLLFVAVTVTIYTEHYIDAGAIGAVILINALIGFLMELQARSSMNALKAMDVILCKVIRDGSTEEIASEKLTPGDVILLEAGDIIPGDGRIIEANQLQCDESSLTGESIPTEKNINNLDKETALGERHNMIFKGASVMNGKGKAIITGIAKHTELGTITSLVEKASVTATPLDKKLVALSKKLIWITLVMTSIFAITGIVQGKSWVLIFETSIALAVAAFPEGLPIVSTVALAYGMLLMAKRNAIVKKLSVVETLGSTNVILTDKTGTLTENTIHVDTFAFPTEEIKVHIENKELFFDSNEISASKENFEKLKLVGALCNNATQKNTEGEETFLGDPIEIALIYLANTSSTNAEEIKVQYQRIAEVPFSSETKIMGTLHKNSDNNFVAAKGSVEHLLIKCNQIQSGKTIEDLNEEGKKKILAESEKMAAKGLRVLAFAYNEAAEINQNNYLENLIYIAMIGFLDPPRLDIKDAILTCKKAGIKIVMITGDHPLTALNIAKKIGLVDEQEQMVISGKELPSFESLTNEWKEKILSASIFARTTPKQKLEIAGVYQAAGNIVAMTGDGVNDAPALKKADVGIAMGLRGTQVAKETASIVLKDDSFNSIAAAVAHGREIFRNIQKFVIYLVSCNLSEIFIVTALGFIAPAATLFPLQILFLNMVTDVFPALALGVGKGDKTIMDIPPRKSTKKIVSNKNWIAISLYAAAITLSVIIAVFYSKAYISIDVKITNNIAFITLALAQLFHVFNMASPRSNILVNEITTNKFVWYAILICIGLMAIVYALPQIRMALGLVILPGNALLVAVIAASLPLALVQLFKLIYRTINKN